MQIERKKNVVIYARVSTKEQEKEGFSIPAQVSYLTEHAKTNGMRILQIFKEAETAKKVGRTQFNKMLKYIVENQESEKNKVDIILVEKTDRLYRNLNDYVKIDNVTKGRDVEIHFVKEGTIISEGSHSSEKFMHGIKVLMAKNYSDNLSEEVKKGHAEKLKRGIWPGKAPQGYVNKLDDHTIVIDPDMGPVIKKGFELASTGNYSLTQLKKLLFTMGLKGPRSGKEIAKSAMKRILSNKFYYGELEYDGNVYKAAHEPLISKELYDKVQRVQGFGKKPSASKKDFAFRGLMTCKSCGCKITAEEKRKKSGRKYIYYHCTNGKKNCNIIYVNEERIEEQFVEAVSRIKLSKSIVEYTKEALLSSQKDEQREREREIERHLTENKRLDRIIDGLYVEKLEGNIEKSRFERLIAEHKETQEMNQNRILALRRSNTAYMLEGIKLMELANSAHKLFPVMTLTEKRDLLQILLSNSTLDGTSVRYNYNKPFNLFVDESDEKKWRE